MKLFNGYTAKLQFEKDYWLAILNEMPSVSAVRETPHGALCELLKLWPEVVMSYQQAGQILPSPADYDHEKVLIISTH